MAIGTNVIDELDELDEFQQEPAPAEPEDNNPEPPVDTQEGEGEPEEPQNEEDFVTALLKSRGIEDKSKIKFEDDDKNIQEVSWDTLSNEERLNILSSSEEKGPSLDDAEIQLINSIRDSGVTPAEYLQLLEKQSVDRYLQNNQQQSMHYTVDDYSDDDLYMSDFMSRTGATEEEAQEALERAKSNEALFNKQIGALRKEYKDIEVENQQYEQLQQQQQAQEQYNQFASKIVDQINDFTEISGYDLNMEQEDMQNLYDFITGFDAAGNNYFAKAMADPKTLVQTAWFALNGQQMIDDITDYYNKEITKVRKSSYEKGLADAKKDNSSVVFKDKDGKPVETFDDLDDF